MSVLIEAADELENQAAITRRNGTQDRIEGGLTRASRARVESFENLAKHFRALDRANQLGVLHPPLVASAVLAARAVLSIPMGASL